MLATARCQDPCRHIQTRPVLAEQDLLVELNVGEIDPHGSVRLAIEHTFLQPLEHFVLTQFVRVAFIVVLVEADPHLPVALRKTVEGPLVHLLPERDDGRLSFLPLLEHLLGLLARRRIFLLPLSEPNIILADKMVPLQAGTLGSLAVTELFVGEHRLADMDATVVDEIDLSHLGSVGPEDRADAFAETVVAHMSEVEGLVGIGTAELHHHLHSALCLVASVRRPFASDLTGQVGGQGGDIDLHIEIRSGEQQLSCRPIGQRLDAGLDIRGDLRRGGFQRLGIGEQRERDVTQLRFRGV
jgi:hypothetical protein